MSEVFNKLKKIKSVKKAGTSVHPDVKGMDINDMKNQILERLRQKRESGAALAESAKPAINADEILRALKKPDEPAGAEKSTTVRQDEELLRRYNDLSAELSEKNAALQDLRQRLETADRAAASQGEALKVKDKKTAEVVKLMRELDAARKASSDYKLRAEGLQSENRKALIERDGAVKQYERLSKDLESSKRFNEEHRVRLEGLQGEHKKAVAERDEAAKLLKKFRAEIEAKENTVQELQKKSARMGELENALRVRDKRINDADRTAKDLEAARNLSEENRVKYENAQAEIKRLTATHEEAAGLHDKLKDEIGKKDTFVFDLQKKYASDLDELTKDRDKAAANVESLRSKLYVATKEAKEHLARITQLEETLRAKDKKASEADKLNAELSTARAGLESKLRAAESGNKNLDEKLALINDELAHGSARLSHLDKTYKDLESANNALNIQLQAGRRDNKDLEAKMEQMRLELAAKINRLDETDKLYKELETAVNDLTVKLQASQKDKKSLEASNGDMTLQLQNAQRDKKALEAHMSQLGSELEAKTARLTEADKQHDEMEALVKDATVKYREYQLKTEDLEKEAVSLTESLKNTLHKLKETEAAAKAEEIRFTEEQAVFKNTIKDQAKKELELRSSVEHLEGEVETRDSKIEGDLKYTDKLVKEIGDLRKKLAALERQAKG